MKKLILLLCFSLSSVFCYADNLSVSSGMSVFTAKNVEQNNPFVKLNYELRYNNFGTEFSAGYYNARIKGETFINIPPHGAWSKSYLGRLHSIPVSMVFKYHLKKLSLGLGGGYQFLFWDKFYEPVAGTDGLEWKTGRARVNNQPFGVLTVGYDFNDHWGLEIYYQHSNFTIESGSCRHGIAEDDSKLNILSVMAKYSF